MENGNSVVTQKEYGRITFHFAEVMREKNINRNQLAQRAGVRYKVADHFYRGVIERLDVDVLARFCYVLGCEVDDVVHYQKAP